MRPRLDRFVDILCATKYFGSMQRMRRLLVVLAALSLCTRQIEAQSYPFTGKTLFDWCISDQRSDSYLHCLLYIAGFLDGFNVGITPAEGPNNSSVLCLSTKLTPGEAAFVFVREWRSVAANEPSKLDALSQEYSQVALSSLLIATYPCKTSK